MDPGLGSPRCLDSSALERPRPAHEVAKEGAVDSGRLVVLVAARRLGARPLGEVDAGQLVEHRVDVVASAALVVRPTRRTQAVGPSKVTTTRSWPRGCCTHSRGAARRRSAGRQGRTGDKASDKAGTGRGLRSASKEPLRAGGSCPVQPAWWKRDPTRQRQWHRVYYGLALFDVLVVAMGLLLNHQIINTHNEAIRQNQVWENRMDQYLDLGTLAGDVATETARRDAAVDIYRTQLGLLRRDMRGIKPEFAQILEADLDVLDKRMADMTGEADLIFGHFQRGHPDLAGSRMAEMDRRYQGVHSAITSTRDDFGRIQEGLFEEQAEQSARLRHFEVLIAIFAVVMISCAAAYGHRIKRELERRDVERARYNYAQLAAANASLNQEAAARAQAEVGLRLSEERYALVARGANDGLWDWDVTSSKVYYAPRWKSLVGYDGDEISGRPGEWLDRVHPEDRTEVYRQLQDVIDGVDTFEIEHRLLHRDGQYRWMLARGLGTTSDGGRRLVGSHSDVDARKKAELRLLHDSMHDHLTGLPNRVLFLDRLDQAIQRGWRSGAAPYAVLYVDLDRFKKVNDRLGHFAGDELLASFAGLLRQVIRPGDTAARLGGDEFAVLLEGVTTLEAVVAVAHRLLTAMGEPFVVDGGEVLTSASIGIAMGLVGDSCTTEVLRHADAALYQAKRDGRGRLHVFAPEGPDTVLDQIRLEIDLRTALAQDELHVVYQPIVSLGDESITGVEALVRWTHPELGPVPPSAFIPIAEESGAITAIGDWVLREACRSIGELNRVPDAESIFVSVNVSPHQLLHEHFTRLVQTVLTETGLTPDHLRLEITETSIVRNRKDATRLLQPLRDLGVQIYIDDFGTGHSALSYVHDLPVDGIKIDRSFVDRLTSTDNGGHLVRAILDLARSVGLLVVAEGVETKGQLAALLQLDCKYGQGYLFDRPLVIGLLEQRLAVARLAGGYDGHPLPKRGGGPSTPSPGGRSTPACLTSAASPRAVTAG